MAPYRVARGSFGVTIPHSSRLVWRHLGLQRSHVISVNRPYTSVVERQLKERLIGAAVLVAAAVIMVPEMFSGSRETVTAEADSGPAANQIKTYRVELQSSPTAAAADTTVEPPAERPLDEVQGMQANTGASESVPSPDEQHPQTAVTQINKQVTAVATAPARQETTKPASSAVPSHNSATGGWVVQVGSFSAQDKAQQIATKLKGQGFQAFVGPVQVNGKTLYRVRVGDLADRAGADAMLQKLRSSYPGASVVPPGR